MDLPPDELQFLTVPGLLRESISIPKRAPRTFYLITLTLIFPLSFAILAHSLFTHPLAVQLDDADFDLSDPVARHDLSLLFTLQFCYLIFLFAFSLLSTAAVVFTAASLYTSKNVTFSNTVTAIPKVFKRLLITFLWVILLMAIYNFFFLIVVVVSLLSMDSQNIFLILMILGALVFFLGVHVYFTALWHLASVVSVLEPIYGIEAMRKSKELLSGKVSMAGSMVFIYLLVCAGISGIFGSVVVHGADKFGTVTRIVVGGLLVGILVLVNFVGLLAQSVFYYVCKSHHHQTIDKTILNEHLGGYLGEYVPLKSNIQLETLEV